MKETPEDDLVWVKIFREKDGSVSTFRHRASCILQQAFHYSPENAFYVVC
jgi:hypothetical protein